MSYDSEHNPVMGIDLGTTNSAIASWKGERKGPVPYEVDQGKQTLQSVVYYDSDNSTDEQYQFLVGKSALRRGELNPSYMAREFKRRMNDASPCILLGGRKFSPVELSAEVLKTIYSDAISPRPGSQSLSTVVTVPYDFDEIACENTKQAAKMANINFKKLLREPIAASLSYALDKLEQTQQPTGEEKFLVFDLGGGTFDLTLFRLKQQPNKLTFEVLATGGHSKLGGIDFDKSLSEFLLERSQISFENVREVKQERLAKRKLKDAVIETKHELSSPNIDSSYFSITDFLPGKNLELMVGRQDFELSIKLYLNKIKSILSQLWKQAQIQPNQVDRIILVGGSSRIPCIRQLLIEIIGSDKIYQHPKPDLCVAEGAAIYAAYLEELDVFGNREVEILTDGFDANISILNQQIEELRQQVSDLEIQLEDKKSEIQTLEERLEERRNAIQNLIRQSPSIEDLQIGDLVEGTVMRIQRSNHTGRESGLLIKGNYEGLEFRCFMHISDIANTFVPSISDYFQIDQQIKVIILSIGQNSDVSVSTKVLEEYPGEMLENMDKVMSEAEARLAQARQKLSL